MDYEVKSLFQALAMEFKLDDPPFTRVVWEQDEEVGRLQLMAAGIAMDLPRSYTEAIGGVHGDEWRQACDREMEMLVKT